MFSSFQFPENPVQRVENATVFTKPLLDIIELNRTKSGPVQFRFVSVPVVLGTSAGLELYVTLTRRYRTSREEESMASPYRSRT